MANSKKPTPNKLVELLLQRLTAFNPPVGKVTLGLSGGLDSVVLFDLLLQARRSLDCSLDAIHINHQLSPHAATWADFCGTLCAQHDVPLHLIKVQISRRSKLGLEAAARAARYQAFASLDTDVLLLAHHLDDQVETLLQNLLRGTGVAGAAGMPETRLAAQGSGARTLRLVRPLIEVPRASLLAYAQQQGLHWVDDESNADSAFTRNFLRHQVLPVIEQRFPAYRDTMARAAQHFAEAEGLLHELATLDLAGAMRAEKHRSPGK